MKKEKIERNLLKKITPQFIQARKDIQLDMQLNKQSKRQKHFDESYKKQ